MHLREGWQVAMLLCMLQELYVHTSHGVEGVHACQPCQHRIHTCEACMLNLSEDEIS